MVGNVPETEFKDVYSAGVGGGGHDAVPANDTVWGGGAEVVRKERPPWDVRVECFKNTINRFLLHRVEKRL